VLIMRYGLFDQQPCTQREIAQQMGISRSYVSRIEKKALSKLSRCFSNKP
jgi:RNA polymerase sporulation-specific sigma factor